MRCTHINRVGEQCRGQAVSRGGLCAFHAGILEGRLAEDADDLRGPTGSRRRLPFIYRWAAALLLLIFLIEIAQSVRNWFQR